MTERAQELALETYRLLGCHGVARVDLMLEEDSGELSVLETNVVPGLTETSLLPMAADAAEIWLDVLVERILDSAFTRWTGQWSASAGGRRSAGWAPTQESPAAKSSGVT